MKAGCSERIEADGSVIAILIRNKFRPENTTFLTENEMPFQVGFVVYPSGGEVAAHRHLPVKRSLRGTSEVVVVQSGRCEIDLYDNERRLIATRLLGQGDVALLLGGGHGFRMLEDTVLLEVKQGPYHGLAEKERF